ncbi:ABC transporter ATP-binding protein [Hoeflea alexandrii]|uniref:ATP-binding cassette domain-containing protein n=1 Tax=Hoeflea alexandrii TaxID=288436 RepID=A0ABT1CL55_9HYPH|nr:ABC transporter ATP-binding protein [Hoeflea alexandrii]MCO6406932.1 ATP-binding cassette domain-containing protein [Hoeflea alexandrii]MCY0154611.1 ABC transporter ATP-binding protein [Hoeflea alexandrii]
MTAVSPHIDTGQNVLTVSNLSLEFSNSAGVVRALDDVSFAVRKGEILSLVGESGCGKSVTAMSIMGLLPRHGARIVSGSVRLGEQELLGASERTMRRVRGDRIGMIFQDPMTSLNPVHTIGMQIAEVVRQHRGLSGAAARARALEMLELVRIPDARNRLGAYPHELSGGMRQRVMIAMALACDPELLIADEPTTALDVTVQAQVLDLIADLRQNLGMSVIFITHDLGVVSSTADRMMVMYAGRIVEEAPVEKLFARPSHGYTAGLLQSLPGTQTRHRDVLAEIPGSVPRLDKVVEGCAYAPRCSFATGACLDPLPPPRRIEPEHSARCIHSETVFETIRNTDIVRAWA